MSLWVVRWLSIQKPLHSTGYLCLRLWLLHSADFIWDGLRIAASIRLRRIDLQIPLLKNKYYFDESYDFIFVKPANLVCRNLRLPMDGQGLDRWLPAQLRSHHAGHRLRHPQLF